MMDMDVDMVVLCRYVEWAADDTNKSFQAADNGYVFNSGGDTICGYWSVVYQNIIMYKLGIKLQSAAQCSDGLTSSDALARCQG